MTRPPTVRIDDLAVPHYDATRSAPSSTSWRRRDRSWLSSRRSSWRPHGPRRDCTTSAPATSSNGSRCCADAMHRGGRLQRRRHHAAARLHPRLLKNRLLIEDLVRRHPEILDEQIAAPIIICGLPRTGTTHLHNLMSADPALRSLPYWESLEPVLPGHEVPGAGAARPPPRAHGHGALVPQHGAARTSTACTR